MRTAVVTVVYPGVEKYLADFFASWASQTDRDFEILVVDAGASELDAHIKSFRSSLPNIHILPARGGVVELRKKAIRWAGEKGFDLAIFSDADDFFKADRVATAKALSSLGQVLFNELILVWPDVEKRVPLMSDRFEEGQRLDSADILNFNCLGLGNTAAWLENIVPVLDEIPDSTEAFDWALFAKVLARGNSARFTRKTATYYRQHSNNIAAPFDLSESQILRGVDVKRQHYAILGASVSRLENAYAALSSDLRSDPAFRGEYCAAVLAAAPEKPLWWEAIKMKEDLGL